MISWEARVLLFMQIWVCPVMLDAQTPSTQRVVCPGNREIFIAGHVGDTPTLCQSANQPKFTRHKAELRADSLPPQSASPSLANGEISTSLEKRDFFRERKSKAGITKVPHCEFAGIARGPQRLRAMVQIFDGELPVSVKHIELKPHRVATPWRVTVRGKCQSRSAQIAPFRG